MAIVTDDFFVLPTEEDEVADQPVMNPVCVFCGCYVNLLYRESHREKCQNA